MTVRKVNVAIMSIMDGGVWESSPDVREALEGVRRRAKDFASALGGFKPDARPRVGVWIVDEGEHWSYDDRGFVVEGEETPRRFDALYEINPHRRGEFVKIET